MTPKRFLIVRTDRLGDVLLTTPVASAIREHLPTSKIDWLVRSYTAPVLANNPDVDQVLLDEGGSIKDLAGRLRGQYDVAIVSLPTWRTASAVWRAGIPMRIGPASKWYSLFFTHRLWQHRSRGEYHEAEFNLALLNPLHISSAHKPTRLVLTETERASARALLHSYGISLNRPLIVLHPGSGGSSQRWPLGSFVQLSERLLTDDCDVVVTAGPEERYEDAFRGLKGRQPIFIPGGSVSLRIFAAILSWAQLVVSNSTGPLHAAVALGVKTVSIYSGIPTCHPRRWGPFPSYPEKTDEHIVFTAGGEGKIPLNLGSVSVDSVWQACQRQLHKAESAPV